MAHPLGLYPKILEDDLYGQYRVRQVMLDGLCESGLVSDEIHERALEMVDFAYQEIMHANNQPFYKTGHAVNDAYREFVKEIDKFDLLMISLTNLPLYLQRKPA